MTYRIYPINLGFMHGFEKSTLTYLRDVGEKISVPLLMWAVVGEAGTILVDSGPDDPRIVKEMIDKDVDRPDGADAVQALRRLGVDHTDVRTIVLSHLHWDHSGNLTLFPNAEILVQREELAYANCPAPCFYRTYAAPVGGFTPTWHKAAHRIRPVSGDYTVAPGIDALHLPGHTPGMQGVAVTTRQGRYVLASDTFNLLENYQQGIPPGIHVNLDDWYRSYARVREVADRVLPAHDIAVLETEVFG